MLGNKYEDFLGYYLRNEYYVIKKNKQTKKNIEALRERFFSTNRPMPLLRIEFKKDYINLSPTNKKGPLIIFPDGSSFP